MINYNLNQSEILNATTGDLTDKKFQTLEMLIDRVNGTENFIGRVVSNEDDFKAGRVRVRIYGIHPEVMPDEALPWAMPMDGGAIGTGFSVPQRGEYVNIVFDGNDINHPRWTASAFMGKKSMPAGEFQDDYPNVIQILEYGDNKILLNRRTGSLKIIGGDGDASVVINKGGSIVIDNSDATDLQGAMSAVSEITAGSTLATGIDSASRAKAAVNASGRPIVIKSLGRVLIRTPEFMLDNDFGATVKPDLLGGPLNCISMCPFAMIPHQGRSVKNLLNPVAEGVYESEIMSRIENGDDLAEAAWDKLMDLKAKSPL